MTDHGPREIRMLNDKGIAGKVFQTGRGMVVNDADDDPDFNPEVDEMTGYDTRQILRAPIRTGCGELLNRLDGRFDDDDLQLLEAMTSGVITVDNLGEIVTCNAAGAEILGCAEDQIVGRSVHELSDKDPGILALVEGAMATNEPVSLMDGDIHTGDDEDGQTDRVFVTLNGPNRVKPMTADGVDKILQAARSANSATTA